MCQAYISLALRGMIELGISHWSRVRENSEKEYFCNFGLSRAGAFIYYISI